MSDAAVGDEGKWYPGKYLGLGKARSSSVESTEPEAAAPAGADEGKWYPGKHIGKAASSMATAAKGGVAAVGEGLAVHIGRPVASRGSQVVQATSDAFDSVADAGVGGAASWAGSQLKAAGRGGAKAAARAIRPVVMPIQALGSVGRVASVNALAMSLPGIASSATPKVIDEIEKALREMHDGVFDVNADLDESIKSRYKVRVVLPARSGGSDRGSSTADASAADGAPASAPATAAAAVTAAKQIVHASVAEPRSRLKAVQSLRVGLSNVSRAVPQKTEDGGDVVVLALEVDADIEVLLRPGAVYVQGDGRHCWYPTVGCWPRRLHVVGPLRVWWDVRGGVLSAIFLSPPAVSFAGATSCTGCAVPERLSDALIAAVMRVVLPKLFTEDDPLHLPIEAPVALRVSAAIGDDDALSTLRGQVKHSVGVLTRFTTPVVAGGLTGSGVAVIPGYILKDARGLVFITHLKVGLGVSATLGFGLIICRLPSGGWSAPSSIATGGIGIGVQTGASKTDTLIILRSADAIRAFSGRGQLKIGTDAVVAVGPIGREVTAETRLSLSAATAGLSYSHSQGLMLGVGLGAELLTTRRIDNEEYHGVKGVTVSQILDGTVPRPDDVDAKALYALVERVCR